MTRDEMVDCIVRCVLAGASQPTEGRVFEKARDRSAARINAILDDVCQHDKPAEPDDPTDVFVVDSDDV